METHTFVKDENFYSVQGWMITKYGLKGNELQCYAIIYGFSQTEGQRFTGSLKYLADWTGATRRTIITTLQSLEKKGLLKKFEREVNKVKYCDYIALKPVPKEEISLGDEEISLGGEDTSQGGEKISLGGENISSGGGEKISQGSEKISRGGEKISPNNININITHNLSNKKNKIKNNDASVISLDYEDLKDPECQKVLDSYHSICKNLIPALWQTKRRNALIKARLKSHSLQDIIKVFTVANSTAALNGYNVDNHVTNIEWILDPENFSDLLSGKYTKAIS